MRNFLLVTLLFIGLTSIANAEQSTTDTNRAEQIKKVLAFSPDGKDEVSAENVLAGKNEFLLAKLTPGVKSGPLKPISVVHINNEDYAVLQSTEDLAALEDKTNKDGKLDSKDKSFDELYAASFVGTEDDKKLEVHKLSNEASAILINKERFGIRVKNSETSNMLAGKNIQFKSRLIRCTRNICI